MLNRLVNFIVQFGSSCVSLKFLVKQTNYKLILPFYHLVSDDNPRHIKNLYSVKTIEQFKQDLEFLLSNYTSISLQQLIELKNKGNNPTQNYFHLTFDDGLQEFYTVVAPILKEKGVHATVFLNSDFIDNKALFYRYKASILYEHTKNEAALKTPYSAKHKLDALAQAKGIDFEAYLKHEKPYLTSIQIKELIAMGFTFGAHSKDHPLYKTLELEQQITQTKASLNHIVELFDLPYRVFAFPFTDDGVSIGFFNAIASYTDLTFGCAGLKDDSIKTNLQRIPMELDQPGVQLIKSAYLKGFIKQKIGKNTIMRQS